MSAGKESVWSLHRSNQPLFERVKFHLIKSSIARVVRMTNKRITEVDMLDIGCGMRADMLQCFVRDCRSATGVDFSVDEQELRLRNIGYYIGDAHEILPKIPDGSYDFVSILSVLEHVSDPYVILHNIRRILRPSGVLLVNSPTWFGKVILENVVIPYMDKDGAYLAQVDTHKRYFTGNSLWQSLVDAGFVSSEIRIKSSNLFCSVTAYATKRTS